MKKSSLAGKPHQEKVVCYTGAGGWSSAMAEVRLKAPLNAAGFQVIQGNDSHGLLVKDLTGVDFVVVQRDFPRQIDLFFFILGQARKLRIPLIYEIDDLLFDLPDDHPDRRSGFYTKGLVSMLVALSKADLVTTSTQPLANFLRPFNPNIKILPNYLADAYWHMNPPRQVDGTPGEIDIGYIGGQTHFPDLKMIVPALTAIIDKYSPRIVLKFWELQPPEELSACSQVELHPSIGDYREFASSFSNSTERIDILIAPLMTSVFNDCKSHLKFLEYSVLGVPAIYSRSVPYEGIVKHGDNGFLASSFEDWVNCLQALIESPDLRHQMAKKAQDTVKKDWLLSHHAQEWAKAYHSVTSSRQTLPDDIKAQEAVFEKVLLEQNSLWNDLQAKTAEKEQSMHALSALVAEKERTVQALSALAAEKEQSVQVLSALAAEKEQSVQALSVMVAEKEQSVQALSALVAEKERSEQALDARLGEIYSSRAWRLTQLLQRVRKRLFPDGSRRKEFLSVIFHLISTLLLQPVRKFRALLVRRREGMSIERWKRFLMKAKNRLRPGTRLFNNVSKKVSIIIPNYNGKNYLGECIDSLHRLDFPSEQYEIIVVDNGSSDSSSDFIFSNYPDVVLIQAERNLGFSGGCNLGIKNSRGEYIVLLNNDTVVDTNWLKELVTVSDSDKEVAIVGSKLLFNHNPTEIQNATGFLTNRGDGGDMGSHQPDEGQYDTTREVMAVCGASMLVRRTLIEEIGALDEDFFAYYEDTDLCYRTRLYGKKIIFASKSVVYHVHAATSGEWSPFFTFLVFRNKMFVHLKNSRPGFLLKVLYLYCSQVIYEGLVRGINRKTHIKVMASFAKNLPKFLVKRFYIRFGVKRVSDSKVLLRLTKVKPKVNASLVKKVCIYNAYLPTMGGGENLTAHTIAHINRIFPSASIDILCHKTETFDNSRFSGKEFVQMFEREFDISLKNTAVRFANINIHQKSFINRMWSIHKLSSITKEYDLFINNTYGSLLPAYAKVNIYSCMFPSKLVNSGTSLMRLFRGHYFNRFLISYDMFLAISQYTQNWIDNYWKVNSYVLYPPVKTLKNSLNRDKENIIISVGRFFVSGHNKKQDVIAKAFIEMCDKGWTKDWKLVLVGRKHSDEGSSTYINSLEEIAKGYPIELRYDISSFELQNLLDKAKIYWHATGYGEVQNISPEKFEHFGLSTIEAAQFGAVPVVFNAGGQPEIINHAKNGFLWNTTDELKDYTKLLMEDERVWNELSSAAFDSMKIFSEEKQLRWFALFLSTYYKFE